LKRIENNVKKHSEQNSRQEAFILGGEGTLWSEKVCIETLSYNPIAFIEM